MPTLLSGPAGGGKSQEARRLLEVAAVPTVLTDFQDLYAALLGLRRDPETGRYPERLGRHAFALATAEYLRRAAITAAREREIDVIVTNSDGDPGRRAQLLAAMGPGAVESILDPGRDEVIRRLSVEGVLSDQCGRAIERWYGNA